MEVGSEGKGEQEVQGHVSHQVRDIKVIRTGRRKREELRVIERGI